MENKTEQQTKSEARKSVGAFRFELKDGVGLLTIDVPGANVNIMSTPVMLELHERLNELKNQTDIKALIIISGKQDNFIAGADIQEISSITDAKDGAQKAQQGQALFQQIYDLPFPVIAAIQGACVGGGLEMALACHFRIAKIHPKTRIGLPEVRLGILPGFGGTQRLPRLIGIRQALSLILTGKLISATQAGKIGLVDKVIPDNNNSLQAEAEDFANSISKQFRRRACEDRRSAKRLIDIFFECTPIGLKYMHKKATEKTLHSTKGFYPAPLKALEAVFYGFGRPLQEGLLNEAQLLGELIASDVSKNLISIFHLSEDLKKQSVVKNSNVEPVKITNVGVVGAGVMGGGVAQLFAYNDFPVVINDINPLALQIGLGKARQLFARSVKKKKLTPSEKNRKAALLTSSNELKDIAEADFIVEAIVENLEIKKKVFAELESKVKESAILASNTSSLSIGQIASDLKRPEQVIGFHFFNPVHRMPLVEIIRGEKTSDETTITAAALARKLGKMPVVIKDSPGFLVNRTLGPYLNEAGLLLEEGVKIQQIDKAITKFGMPMGPLELLDEVGLDVAGKVAQILQGSITDREIVVSPVIEKLINSGRLGKKSGKGFYSYQGGQKKSDESVYQVLAVNPNGAPSENEIVNRLLFAMLKEAVHCLEESVVSRVGDLDAAMIFGIGFPPFRGGLLKYADTLGLNECKSQFEKLHEKHGDRFAAPAMIARLTKEKASFYSTRKQI